MKTRHRKEIIKVLLQAKRFDLAQAMSTVESADWGGPSPQNAGPGQPEGPRPEPYKDNLPGGIGDNTLPADVDPEQLEMGVKVEMEHTDDPKLAKEIAIDHLTEDPKYYTKLQKIESH